MKKYFAYVLIAFVLSALCFSAEPIYKYETSEKLTETTVLTRVKEFYADYNISYSYIKMDLTDDRVKMKLLKSDEGTDVLDTVTNLALTDSNTVAAINGDFFSVYSGRKGFSLGIEKTDGVITQSPINPSTMATIAYDGKSVLMSYLDFHVMAVAPNWEYKEVRHINKHTSYFGDILMYTHEFNGGYSPAPGADVLEVVVDDGKIMEFRRNMEPCLIPENGCVLVVSEGSTMFFANNFNVGDEIRFDTYITPSLDGFDTAFGGGSMLVYEGQDVGKIGDYAHTVAGLHPRSAIGVDKEGTTLYLVAVDGRQASSRGMRMSHLAELLIDLGCYMAVNLDGGGSTNMVASSMWYEPLHTVNSPTENRRVINAIGIVLNNENSVSKNDERKELSIDNTEIAGDESGEDNDKSDELEKTDDTVNEETKRVISGVSVRSDRQSAFVGQPVKIEVAVYDSNMRPIPFDEEDIKWYVSNGQVEDFVFSSQTGGKITVGVSIEECYSDTEIFVVDDISGIVTQNYIYMEKGDSTVIDMDVFDYSGRFLEISDTGDFEITSSDENVAIVENDVIRAVGNGNATVTVSKNGIFSHISVAVGSYPVDYLDDFEKLSGSFSSYPRETKGSYDLSGEQAYSGICSGKLSFDFTDEAAQEILPQNDDGGIEINENSYDVSRGVYFTLNDGVAVDENCNTVSLKVYSEEPFLHTLKLQFSNADGRSVTTEYDGEILENGWTDVVFAIPDDAKRPLKLTHVYVLYTPGELKDVGSIYLDDLSFESCNPYLTQKENSNVYRYNVNNSNITSSITIGAVSSEYSDNPIAVFERAKLRYNMGFCGGFLLEKNMQTGITEDENALYVMLDTSRKGIRNTDSTQWNKLANAVNTTQKKNVFILTNDNIFGNDEFENEVICDFLAGLDKNVFVVSPSDSATYRNISGVKYFTLDVSLETSVAHNRIKKQNTIEFFFGDTITYKF